LEGEVKINDERMRAKDGHDVSLEVGVLDEVLLQDFALLEYLHRVDLPRVSLPHLMSLEEAN